MRPRKTPAQAIAETVAGSPLADPVDRAEAMIALAVGDWPPQTLLELLEEVDKREASNETAQPLDVGDLVRRMARLKP